LLEIFEDEQFVYLTLEFQSEGSLLNEIIKERKLSEDHVRLIMEQLLLTLDYMHQKDIIHRDIKLDNILINKKEEGGYNVKIADFGMATFSKKNKGNLLYTKCGTPGYVAPEILRGEGYDGKCDLFSTGSLLFNLLTGLYLFAGEDNKEILKSNKRCDLSQVPSVTGNLSRQC